MADDRPGGEPTEEPTPRRLEKARREGDVARSADLTTSFAFLAACGALAAGAGTLAAELAHLVRRGLIQAVSATPPTPGAALEGALEDLARLVGPILGAAFLTAAVVGGLQAGGLFALGPILPKGQRLDPLEGLRRLWSVESLTSLLKAV